MWYVVRNLKIVSELCFQELFLSLPDNARLNLQTVIGDDAIRRFFVNVSEKFLDHTDWSARCFLQFENFFLKTLSHEDTSEKEISIMLWFRLDFLATYAAENIDGNLICRTMKQMLDCEVGMIKDLEGKEVRDPQALNESTL